MKKFKLPPAIADLVAARNNLRAHYQAVLPRGASNVDLSFTLDGNLVGDLGEAIAAELFGVRLVETKIDGGH
ncbi:hypothetical protein [Mesorhizobium sp.]|uniref:DUF6998 domain-containing protein n=1 Tax=Mesorhizobium sp. TaxID=1871066 RepID=UPI0025E82F02|nr:hypothetical protein [Mesorhizobium sp.]